MSSFLPYSVSLLPSLFLIHLFLKFVSTLPLFTLIRFFFFVFGMGIEIIRNEFGYPSSRYFSFVFCLCLSVIVSTLSPFLCKCSRFFVFLSIASISFNSYLLCIFSLSDFNFILLFMDSLHNLHSVLTLYTTFFFLSFLVFLLL